MRVEEQTAAKHQKEVMIEMHDKLRVAMKESEERYSEALTARSEIGRAQTTLKICESERDDFKTRADDLHRKNIELSKEKLDLEHSMQKVQAEKDLA